MSLSSRRASDELIELPQLRVSRGSVSSFEQTVAEESTPDNPEPALNYPTGLILWLNVAAVLMVAVVKGLDLTIVAVAVPSLTDQFKTLNDVGWYSAAYGLCSGAFTFFFGKIYVVFPLKQVYLTSIIIFAAGSLICTLAASSKMFILGRAIAGLGSSGIGNGSTIIMSRLFPLHKRPLWFGITGGVQSVALVSAPLIGGALIDALSWRACFGINMPLSAAAVAMIWFGFHDPTSASSSGVEAEGQLRFREKLAKLNLPATLVVMPCITSLLIALQWGGIQYAWNSAPVIALLSIFGAFLLGLIFLQYRYPEKAVMPNRILKNRSVMAGAWFEVCCDGSLAVTEYYISIYFQGIRGYTATKSGLLGIPMLVGLLVASLAAGAGTTIWGYYTPFMLATTIIAPIPAGLLTTLDPTENLTKCLLCLAFLGAAVGLGISAPSSACQTTLSASDVPLGNAMIIFGGGMGSSLFVTASATLFQNRLVSELSGVSEGLNATTLDGVGLADIRGLVPPDRLMVALKGYDNAVVQTLYLPLALTISSLVGSLATEWRSVKQKIT